MEPLKNRILIVDDEELLRESLKDLLSDLGYSVFDVKSIKDALNCVKDNEIDLVVVDMHLPDGSGEELILKLSALSQKLKYIIHTGVKPYLIPDQLRALGISKENIAYKPIITISNFLQKIKHLLSN